MTSRAENYRSPTALPLAPPSSRTLTKTRTRRTSTDPTSVGSVVYFTANDGVHGAELWKSNGTSAGTTLVADLDLTDRTRYSPEYLTAAGGSLFFTRKTETTGQESWKTNGTAAGTFMVQDLDPGASGVTPTTSPRWVVLCSSLPTTPVAARLIKSCGKSTRRSRSLTPLRPTRSSRLDPRTAHISRSTQLRSSSPACRLWMPPGSNAASTATTTNLH